MIKHTTKLMLLAAALFACNALASDAPSVPAFAYQFSTVGPGEGGRNNGDEVLRIVRREHTGRAVGLQVLTSVLAGGVYGGGFKKTQLHGQRIKDIPNPGRELLLVEVRRQIEQWQAAHPALIPQEVVTVSLVGSDWVLLYQELDEENTPYELRYRTGLTLRSPSRGFFKKSDVYGGVECGPEPVVQGYDAWADNEFAGVKAVQLAYVKECAAKFAEHLPTWLAALPMRDVPAASMAAHAAAAAEEGEATIAEPEQQIATELEDVSQVPAPFGTHVPDEPGDD